MRHESCVSVKGVSQLIINLIEWSIISTMVMVEILQNYSTGMSIEIIVTFERRIEGILRISAPASCGGIYLHGPAKKTKKH